MERFLSVEIAPQLRNKGNRDGLIDAIYREGELKIEYDSVMTRNAAQAFAARSGNCLSLVIMTAAFAKALGLPVQFQSVSVDETVSRSDDIYFFIGHVNLTLGNHHAVVGLRTSGADLLTVDFLPLLFNPFAREQTYRHASAGLGLGLYISERIVAAHGGTLSVPSSEAAGTQFEVRLPRRPS
jgi:transglutaminase-like putative cysteine protease